MRKFVTIASFFKSKSIYKNIGLSMVLKPFSLIISFFAVPLTISYLGDLNFGLWSTILSIVSWVNFFDIGVGNGLRNKLTISLNSNDFTSAKSYIVTSYIVVVIIAFLMFLVSIAALMLLNWNNVLNVDTLQNYEIRNILLINFFFLCMNFILKINTNIFYAIQQAAIVSFMQLLSQILIFFGILCLIVFKVNDKLIYLSLIYGFAELIINVIFTFYLFKYNKQLFPKITSFDIKKVFDLTNLGVKFFIIQIAAMIIFTTDNIIISNIFGPIDVTPYNITFKVFNLLIILHTIVITPLWSAITKAQENNDFKWINNIVILHLVFQMFIAFASFMIYLNFKWILNLWFGNSSTFEISSFLVLCFTIYTFIATWSNGFSYIMNGLGIMNIQIFIAFIQGLINIPISIYFAKNLGYGVTGVILGTIISLSFSFVIYPIVTISYIRKRSSLK